ncbi:N-acetylgalactosamine kinase-like isoform X2 [Penaeus japonicus]|uniref:N-acetylgalactosamine kinase-like isoform X2 n=1 Tax=Penaeus japonicus TaxID=27405 RepID=UPI001C70BEBB|nr:N-acetylgalactosamine kinase-like isoform X2 [Penaeus japonicus]
MPEVISSPPLTGSSHQKVKEMSTECPPIQKLPTEGKQAERLASLQEKFNRKYNKAPEFFARAPGRVNLIGEHVDYCGYAVFPMAIEQDILVAVSTNSAGTLRLSNVEDSYPTHSSDINKIEIQKERPAWFNYVLCAIKGIAEEGGMEGPLTGLDLMVSGNIPPSSGLSSSSALVCAVALAVSHAHDLLLAKEALAEICASCERHVGTQGGGMDQAISFLGTPGTARVIEFNPLKSTPVALPPGATFVVANCLAPMNKAATSHYNCRVMECRLACQIMAKKAGLVWKEYRRLGDLQKVLGKSLPEMMTLVSETFEARPYSKEEICELLKTTPAALDKTTLSENTRHIQHFKLHDRAQHVFSEAHRVWEFKRICEEESETALSDLGRLMQDSHRSTKLLYECSHPKLDALVELSQGMSLGARLTGAGWGGCMVALVKEEEVENYKAMLLEEFYSQEPVVQERDMDTILFSSQPGSGACIFK